LARENRVLRVCAHEDQQIAEQYEIETGKHGIVASSAAGSIHRAKHKKTGLPYAVKQLFKKSFKGNWWGEEIENIMRLDHPHICRIFETWEDSENVYLVMELCSGGDLTSLAHRNSKKMNEATIAVLVRQMVSAVEHFHRCGSGNRPLVHTDIRLENWLFVEPLLQHTHVEDMSLKMIDYGLAMRHALMKGRHHANEKVDERLAKRRLTARDIRSAFCKAPEQIQEQLSDHLHPAMDTWALGVIAYFLLSGVAPFSRSVGNMNCERLKKAEYKFEPEKVWKVVTQEAKDFIRSCLQLDPAARPSATELLEKSSWMHTAKDVFDRELQKRQGSSRNNRTEGGEASALQASARQGNGNKQLSILDQPLPSAENVVQAFAKMNKLNQLEKAAVTAAAHRLPAFKLAGLRQAFEKMDKNGDGVLTAHELYAGLKDSGVEEEALLEMLKDVDSDGSGAIEYTEFIASVYDFQRNFQDNVVWSIFKLFDQDASGHMTKQELKGLINTDPHHRNSLQEQFPDTLESAIDKLDQDGDGEISFEEFKGLLRPADKGERKHSRR
jgi:calcium-dependent protein kinase